MGVEVSWRLIKQVCPGLASLSEFISALCKFICSHLREEHRNSLLKDSDGDANAFIRDPTATKQAYDAIQVVHPKTLCACFIT